MAARALLLFLAIALGAAACEGPGRSVRTWIEARDPAGHAVEGATVSIDGRPTGITDHRGLFRVKLRRHAGETVGLKVAEEAGPSWEGSFVVGTNGGPAGSTTDRIVVVLPAPARSR